VIYEEASRKERKMEKEGRKGEGKEKEGGRTD